MCKREDRGHPLPRPLQFFATFHAATAARLLVWPIVCCVLAAGLARAPLPAGAALKAKGAVTAEEAWNPHPAAGDVALPMPCGAGMVFRIVAVPAKGFLWDMPARLGRDDGAHADRAYYDSRYNTALSGPFAAGDLPAAWRASLPEGEYFYYLMGKYEVTGLQWRAIMDNACPSAGAPLTAADALPKTGISWYEAVDFTRRYTDWLLKNHPAVLPHFQGDARNVGFVRLPTEAEWEYAARGGQAVTGAHLRQEDFFPMAEGAELADYAVFRPEGAARIEESPLRIGSRKPNPLGLYDTAGNVAEMVMDAFRFSLGGRLHGSAGGFVRKGGSFLSGQAEIMPGRREETAFFQADGPVRARDLGFRAAISGINTPGGARPAILLREWQKAGEDYGPLPDEKGNPLEEIDRLLSLARTDAERENFQRLRGIIKDNNIALERQQALAAESLVRSSVYMIETIRNYAIRRKGVLTQMELMKKEKKAQAGKKTTYDFDADIKKAREGAATLGRGVDASLGFYRSKIEDSRAVPQNVLDAAFKMVEKDLKPGDAFSENLRRNLRLYARHTALLRKGQRAAVDKQKLTEDILPARYRQ